MDNSCKILRESKVFKAILKSRIKFRVFPIKRSFLITKRIKLSKRSLRLLLKLKEK